MTLKQAFFILRHGSAEGNHKYLEAVKVIEDEFNRQKAEIEKLTINMNAFGLAMKREKERADSARTEAVKEFADRLKVNILHKSYPLKFSAVGEIDNLVKEFTEGEKT